MMRHPRYRVVCLGFVWFAMLSGAEAQPVAEPAPVETYDVVVYGGTSAGVIAAVQAKRLGKSVALVGPDVHLGGLTSGGLGFTDTGNKAVIGGLAREFYHRVWQHYQQPEAWRWEARDQFGNRGQGTPAIDGAQRTMWVFEPHVAEQVFDDLVQQHEIPLHCDEWLDRQGGVRVSEGRIVSIAMLSGKTLAGKMFIDATYEGDLLAAAGVEYIVGREANAVYGETFNGVQTGVLHHGHHFGVLQRDVSPYVVPDDPASGVLPRISTEPPGEYGSGDHRVQAYCYRMCLTDHPENRLPIAKPPGYDPWQYELLARVFEAGWRGVFEKFDMLPNRKTDTNNHGPFSTDNIGMNYDYPEGSYARRREILDEHRAYQQGWLYFLAHDPRVPARVQQQIRQWGPARDEFTDNDGWPHQIYVREARRMVGLFVMTEHELTQRRPTPDAVGMGSYTIDSHNVQRYITPEGHVQNEGDIGVGIAPYMIAYGSLVPRKEQCQNLLVPVCVSASHTAFGSIRMEPVFMVLGQSAGTAAALAIEADLAVQDVAYETLRARLLHDGQVLEYDGAASGDNARKARRFFNPRELPGVVVDDNEAVLRGDWRVSGSVGDFIGSGYRHDANSQDGSCRAEFATRLPRSGRYEVRLVYTPNPNRASRVPVEVEHARGRETIYVNQKKSHDSVPTFQSLGTFEFVDQRSARVTVSNVDADGYVVVDAVQWVPQDD